jgi:SAM-dependent methyltransferase
MKLNLGCGILLLDDFLNVDKVDIRVRFPERVEGKDFLQCDLNKKPWPWLDSTAEAIVMRDSLEHLTSGSFIEVMEEVWRVLVPNGQFACQVPDATTAQAFVDPTHTMFFTYLSMDYFDPDRLLCQLLPHYSSCRFHIIKSEAVLEHGLHFLLRKIP